MKHHDTVSPKVRGTRLSPGMVQRIAHQIEVKGRDVAPHAYGKPEKEVLLVWQ